MKKFIKGVVSVLLAASFMTSVAGCSIFDKAGKLCVEVGDQFIEAALEREIEDMADLCYDDEEAMEILGRYASSVDEIDAILEKATFKATKRECSTKDGKGTVTYTITLPDYEAALDEDPDDVDEFIDLLDDVEETIDMEIKLSFKLHKDNWYVSNYDDFAEDFYEELNDIDFPFVSPLASQLEETRWYFIDAGDQSNPIYENPSSIDLEIWISGSYSGVTYTIEHNGRVIYTGNGLDAWVSAYEIGSGFEYEPGSYTISFYDSDGRPIYSDTCTVR